MYSRGSGVPKRMQQIQIALAEYEGSIPFTRSNVHGGFTEGGDAKLSHEMCLEAREPSAVTLFGRQCSLKDFAAEPNTEIIDDFNHPQSYVEGAAPGEVVALSSA
jgi:hypothetical protein